MSDQEFPSGPWTGFYNYGGDKNKHRMDLVLSFSQARVSGEGQDDVGEFIVDGRFDVPNRECHWTKTYVAAHDVFYRGFREEGKGIWGVWELTGSSGGFHIWPLGEGDGEQERAETEEPLPAEVIGTEA